MTLYYSVVEHPLTRLMHFSSENGLRSVFFIPQDEPLPDPESYYPSQRLQPDRQHHGDLARQLHLYFKGIPVTFNVTLDLAGTPFQKRVWEIIGTIPFGRTLTYGEIAAQAGNPKGSRAVGGATGRNPVPIIVP